ncbi:MAG: glycosyltransferase [Verrucomicrobia bacterium]|nr:glycosyltransferase [Verrucomicrobiota bacterium]MBI3870680.1 glycosyltransferase [Verrucomicrobiota bacterium]
MNVRRYRSLNFGDDNCASSRYRILAYVDGLRARGVDILAGPADDFSAWDDLARLDGVIVQKKLFSVGRSRWIRRAARRLIYDIDDAIWLPQGRRHHWWTRLRTVWRLRTAAAGADVCVAANRVIAARLEQWARRVEVMPMALDEATWTPALRPAGSRDVVLGWSGAPGNLRYLEPLEPALVSLQQRHPTLTVRVVCGERPRWTRARFQHIPWRPGVEAEEVNRFDIGLLPLETSAFAAAKSPIKALQYMASGIPTVATPLAATRELFGDSEAALFAEDLPRWESAISELIERPEERERRGASARRFFLSQHTLSRGIEFWARLLTTS